jgi:hypothetical protein
MLLRAAAPENPREQASESEDERERRVEVAQLVRAETADQLAEPVRADGRHLLDEHASAIPPARSSAETNEAALTPTLARQAQTKHLAPNYA